MLDIEMPGMNGWDALNAIRQLPGYQEVPIILFTVYHDAAIEARAKQVGANLLLKKPVLPHEFGRLVREAILSSNQQVASLTKWRVFEPDAARKVADLTAANSDQ